MTPNSTSLTTFETPLDLVKAMTGSAVVDFVRFLLVAIGATALVARFVGARDHSAARHVLHQAVLVGSLLAVIATLVTWTSGHFFVHAMQLEPDAAALAVPGLRPSRSSSKPTRQPIPSRATTA